MDGLLADLRDNVSITVYFEFTYSALHRCIVFFLSSVSLLHYLAIQPSRLQGCSNKISCQLSSNNGVTVASAGPCVNHLQASCCHPTNSVKALKATSPTEAESLLDLGGPELPQPFYSPFSGTTR